MTPVSAPAPRPVRPVRPQGRPATWRPAPAPAPAPAIAPAPVAPRAAAPGLLDRIAAGWKKAWAPSWAGVPQWIHDLWVGSGKLAVRFHAAAPRPVREAVGVAMAWVWRAVDGLAGLRATPRPPALLPTEPLEAPLARFPGPLSRLSTRGNRIVDAAGRDVRLRGVNLSGFEYDRAGGSATAANLDRVKAMGGNVVRLPINQGWALGDAAYMARLDATIAEAARRGIYVVVDLHWIASHQTALPDGESARMWRRLANRWSRQPNVVLDLHNEPGMVGWEAQARWSEHLIAAIRSVSPQALVMVEGTNKAQRIAAAVDRPIKADNVVYQVHAYGPRQHGPGVGPAQWDRLFGGASSRLPVFVGELGGEPDELPAMKELIAYLDARGLGWAAWHTAPGDVFAADGGLSPLGRVVADGLRGR